MADLEITLRPMSPSDIQRVCEIIAQHSDWDARAAKVSLQRAFKASEAGILAIEHVVAVVDDVVIGVSGWCESMIPAEGVFWLSWTYVDRAFRRCGVGSALIRHVLNQLRRRGARRLYLDTGVRGYEAAIAFYERHGFVRQAVLEDFYAPGDHCLVMARDI